MTPKFGVAYRARFRAHDSEFKESEHHRGQPGNAGQFGSGGSSKKSNDRETKIARLKAIGEEIKPFVTKGDLTAIEARHYEKLNKEASELRFEVTRPLTPERVSDGGKSTLKSAAVVAAHNDMLKRKPGYMALMSAVAGAQFDADTEVDKIMNGRNPDITASEFYHQFDDTRAALLQP